MSKRRTRCTFVVPGSGNGDRCRRYAGHVGSDQPHARWHLPDCGSAVAEASGTDDGSMLVWIHAQRWIDMFHDVQRADGIVRSLRVEESGDG